ncbi:ABC transporter substrate-binding protein [Lentibacillus salinarum]|uniref:ABC transporter substrate-binding protein n=1 Tax=Lentibacillus salinarum TaxID=446820 RepID=A0ABW3ZR08_9BACI
MLKRLFLISGTFFLVIILAACGGAAIESTSDEGEADSGDSDEAVKIGAILPFSGVYAALGEDLRDGMNLYFDSIDWEAGGREIEMIEEDTEADPQVALRKTRKLMDQNDVDFLTGAVSTAVAYAIRDEVDENKLPYVASHAGGNDLTREQRSDYIWRTSFSSWQIGNSMGEWVYENIGDRIYVTAADYAFGREASAAFIESYTEAGGEVVGEVYPPLENNDYASYLTTISNEDVDGVYGFFAGSDAARFVQQYDEYGLKEKFPLIGSTWLVAEDVRESVGDAAEGIYASTFWDYTLESEENKAFVEAYEAAYDRRPTIESLEGYDAARVIADALESLEGDTSDPDRIVEAISNATFTSPRGEFKFDKDTHHVIQDMYITETVSNDEGSENNILHTLEKVKDPGE